MSETEPMSIDERRKYIHKMWGRYRKGSKKEKGELLDEMRGSNRDAPKIDHPHNEWATIAEKAKSGARANIWSGSG